MKLILTSDSITIPAIADKIIEFTQKAAEDIKFAIINEAYAVEEGSHNWILRNLDTIRKYFGDFNIHFVNLLALDIKTIEERINNADVIFCCGGNTEYLQTVFEKTGFDKLLPKLLTTKVFVGTSAGSMIVGKLPTLEVLNEIYDATDLFGISDYLGLYNFSILPHTSKKHFNNRFMACVKESTRQTYPVYSLSDTSALIIDGNKEYMIGEDCYKLLKGKIVDKID